MSTDAVLLAIAPELASVDVARRTTILDLAKTRISDKVFGTDYSLAVAYVAAHMLTMSARAGAGGAISSESEGALSRSYTIGNGDGYNATSYGREYLLLRKQRVVGAVTGYGTTL